MTVATIEARSLTIGPGTPFRLESWPSWVVSAPEIRTRDTDRPYAHGIVAGGDFYGARSGAIDITLGAATRAEALDLIAQVRTAFAPSGVDEALTITLDDEEYYLVGRYRGATAALSPTFNGGRVPVRCRFVATDPLLYSATEESVLIDLSDVGEGFVLPIELPAIIDGTTGAGVGAINNTGSDAVHWTATLTGPLGNPLLTQVDTGRSIRVLTTLGAGETAELDSRRSTVFIGDVSRPDLVVSAGAFFTLPPGSSSISFTADTGTGTALVRWRPGSA